MKPISSKKVKNVSSKYDRVKSEDQKLHHHFEQALDNILCLENIRNEQFRFVLKDLNEKSPPEYRILLREDWSNQVRKILSNQKILLEDCDPVVLEKLKDHGKIKGLKYDDEYYKEFLKNYIGLSP